MADEKDLYKILGVKEDAGADAIKKAYRDLAKRFHPDRTGGDKGKEQRFKEISAAYEVLSDPKRREQYDLMRRGGFGPGPGGGVDFSAFAGIDGIEELFGSIFGNMRGGAGPAGGRRRGSRVVYETRPFGGFEGQVFETAAFDPFTRARPAPPVEEVVRAKDGTPLTRRGKDVHGEVEVTIEEAVLGAKVEVPTLDGRVTITVPPGTSSGRRLRLRGKGPAGGGDHYVAVKIVVPQELDKQAEELLREFSRRAKVVPRR
jgi:DnaJ-class molecular chaperone